MIRSGTLESSSSSPVRWRYDVFLSFRGEDTRINFVDHLYSALSKAGFRTFIDNDGIRRGENIGLEIENAIQESRVSLVILSENYASSTWCLDELVQIMWCRKNYRHHVIPVFYYIDPSQVRKQGGAYAAAFSWHETQIKRETNVVKTWRIALREVADLGGMVLQNRNESAFIEDVLKEIRKKLYKQVLHVPSYIVGRKNLVHKINRWLWDGVNDVRIAIIFGIGGVGKTTLASIVFNSNFDKFEASSFLANINEASQEVNGLVRLQMQLVSDLLKEKHMNIWNIHQGIMEVKYAVSNKRVLLVLDDMDDLDQFEALAGMSEFFHPGSKIIVTTRNGDMPWALYKRKKLWSSITYENFEVKGLLFDDSLKLLSWHAFGQGYPAEEYMEYSKPLVEYCCGLPLALKVIGSSLSGKAPRVWESEMEKLKDIMDAKIQRLLVMSYNCLPDDHDKSLFLDISCFFVGMDEDYVVRILKGCGYYPTTGIQNLIDRCLISINSSNKIEMHQLMKNMGREIVRQESPENPSKRSRIWHIRDALKDAETVKGFSLHVTMSNDGQSKECTDGGSSRLPNSGDWLGFKHCLSFIPHWKPVHNVGQIAFSVSNEEELQTNQFGAMHRLTLLKLNHVKLTGTYAKFPKGLVWLCWHGFPYKSIPKDFYLANLVVLELCNSQLSHNWKNGKVLRLLKTLDLSHCYDLIRTPDFEGLPSLEQLVLNYCINLVEVDDSVSYLQRLLSLRLCNCSSLRKLSTKVSSLRLLEELDLTDCSQLEDFSMDLEEMVSLAILRLDGISLNRSECSRRDLTLSPSQSRNFQSNILKPINFSLGLTSVSLVELSLADCNLSDDFMSLDFSRMGSLEMLDISCNPFRKLPEGIASMRNLQTLRINRCTELQSIPELPAALKVLEAFQCVSLESITTPQDGTDCKCKIYCCTRIAEVLGLQQSSQRVNSDIEELDSLNLEPIETFQWETHEADSDLDVPKGPLQVLVERGTSSFFQPGSGIQRWYRYRNTGSSVSFIVLPSRMGQKISGLNVCIRVKGTQVSPGTTLQTPSKPPAICFKNVTRDTQFAYLPFFWGTPVEGNDVLWLTHWKLDNHIIDVGDQVEVFAEVRGRRNRDGSIHYTVEECGVDIVHRVKHKENEGDYYRWIYPKPWHFSNSIISSPVGSNLHSIGVFNGGFFFTPARCFYYDSDIPYELNPDCMFTTRTRTRRKID